MSNFQLKKTLVEKLESSGEYFRQVNDVEYRCRCHFCGDSDNQNTGHLYIRINFEDNFPMVYHCFKCEMSGVVNQDFLTTMDIDDLELKSKLSMYNKHADNMESYKFINGDKTIIFDYTLPDEFRKIGKVKYLEERLGVGFNPDDMKHMKIITSLKDFLLHNDIHKITCKQEWANRIEDHYIGFLTFGGSHIMFRDITETEEYSWIKYAITPESNQCRAFYTMEAELDIFTEDKIIINMAEGILDIVSVCYNFNHDNPNTLNIAVGGKGYCAIIEKLLDMGLVGNNIILNIYADNDAIYNKKAKKATTVEYFKKLLRTHKHLFGEVNIWYNQIGKDVGVTKDKIILKKYKI